MPPKAWLKHPVPKQALARRLAIWLLSPEGQAAIGAYEVDGEQQFHPSAAAPKRRAKGSPLLPRWIVSLEQFPHGPHTDVALVIGQQEDVKVSEILIRS